MGTDRISNAELDHISNAELVERAIDWIENNGMALLPWQAEAFRAIMLPRVREFNDESPTIGMVKVQRNGKWVWEFQCTCTYDDHGFDSGCPVHDTGEY